MTRRRRIELYSIVFVLAATVRLLHPFIVLAEPLPSAVLDRARLVLFLDRCFDFIPHAPHALRNFVNLATAALWGLGLGSALAILLVDRDDRWRILPTPTSPTSSTTSKPDASP